YYNNIFWLIFFSFAPENLEFDGNGLIKTDEFFTSRIQNTGYELRHGIDKFVFLTNSSDF
ncbi:hypothetical protein ACJX0J_008546, partial [Zea mays]